MCGLHAYKLMCTQVYVTIYRNSDALLCREDVCFIVEVRLHFRLEKSLDLHCVSTSLLV